MGLPVGVSLPRVVLIASRGSNFEPEIIELCVLWYLTYRLSYRDLVEMMAERGVIISHSTILRWVQRYVPEFERRWSRNARGVHSSWRMDETAVSVRGGTCYLYRAVDKYGKTVDSLLCADRSGLSARKFFTKALKTHYPRWPTKLNLDGNAASHRALFVLRQENPDWQSVEIRSRRYLNNIVEQDHRAIKRRCAPMLAMKSFRTAATTLAGVELAHRIRKRQFTFGPRAEVQRRCTHRARDSPQSHVWPRLHQNSATGVHMLTEAQIQAIKPVRYDRRVSDGHDLYLLVTPKGALHWRFRYRFAGKCKTLALGSYPVVTLDWARSRHKSFRDLLAYGIDLSALKTALGKHRFGVTMRAWEAEQGRMHSGIYLCPLCGVSRS
jgi:transposase-like protein